MPLANCSFVHLDREFTEGDDVAADDPMVIARPDLFGPIVEPELEPEVEVQPEPVDVIAEYAASVALTADTTAAVAASPQPEVTQPETPTTEKEASE